MDPKIIYKLMVTNNPDEAIKQLVYFDKENEELRKRNKELEEGFKATIEELCETTEENENLKEVIETIKRTNLLLIKQKAESEDNLYMLDKRIDKAIEYIENDMPYLEEPDEEFERCDGTTYMTMKEYDASVLLNILQGSDKE